MTTTLHSTPTTADTGRRSWIIVFGILFVCAWSGNQFSPMLLLYKNVDHYSASMVTLFLGVYVVGLAPAFVLAGALSDHFGRRPPMLCAVLSGVTASVLLALGELGWTPILIGRLFAGVAVGTATAVGTSWLKEVSQPPFDLDADVGLGARRSSVAFTTGSALGALTAGSIAQWGPWPEVLPYLIHIVVTLPFLWLIRRTPETVVHPPVKPSVRSRLRVGSVRHRRFLRVVVVCGPWLFAACALAYGYLPVLLADRSGSFGLAYATGLSVVALLCGALIQPVAKRIDSVSSARGTVVALVTLTAGVIVMIAAVALDNLWIGVLANVVFGCGFGVGLVSGLMEVQRLAPPQDLARLTGIFYAIAYLGFALPTLLAVLESWVPVLVLLGVVVALLVVSTVVVLGGYRKHLPNTARRIEHTQGVS